MVFKEIGCVYKATFGRMQGAGIQQDSPPGRLLSCGHNCSVDDVVGF